MLNIQRTINMKKLLTGTMLMVAAFTAEAGVIRHDVDDQAYLDYAQQSQFAAVGDLLSGWGTSFYSRCSGTLIDSNMILTAAHCVDNTQFEFMNFAVGSGNYWAESWVAHENWDGSLFSGWDIALVKLFDDVDDVAAANLYTGNSEIGQVGSHVGFGRTGNGLTGDTDSSGTKRAGQNAIDATNLAGEGHDRILYNDFDAPVGTDLSTGTDLIDLPEFTYNPLDYFGYDSGNALELEISVAPGDSGGALFLEENDEWYVAGVHSFGVTAGDPINFGYGEFNGSTRVSAFTDWIASTQELLDPSEVSAPATLLLTLSGIALAFGSRRRKVSK